MTGSAHDRMCAAIAECHAERHAEIDAMPIAQQLEAWTRVATNLEPERQACEVRLRAERCYSILLRDAAGLPPKKKRDAAWLAQFGGRRS